MLDVSPVRRTRDRLPAVQELSLTAWAGEARFFSSTIEIDVHNGSPLPMLCRLRGRTLFGTVPLRPEFVWVDSQTSAELKVTVPMRFPRVREAVVIGRQIGRDVFAETAVRPPRGLFAVWTLMTLLLVSLTLAGLRAAFAPHVSALIAPAHVFTGQTVDVHYATAGIGGIRYDVLRDSRTVATASVRDRSGTFGFVPPAAGAYVVRLSMNGIAGAARSDVFVRARDIPRPKVTAAITSLLVYPPVATSGTAMRVSYAASGENGRVYLMDAKGTTWYSSPWSRNGDTYLIAPNVSKATPFRIALNVFRTGSSATVETGVLVVPPAPKPNPAQPQQTNHAGNKHAPQESVTTDPPYVVSGSYFTVELGTGDLGALTDRVTLQSPQGVPVASHAPQDGKVLFVAPLVSQKQRFYLVLTISRKRGGGLLVQPVEIHPH